MPGDYRDSSLSLSYGDAVHRLRDTLDQVGYTEARVLEMLGYSAMPALRTRRHALPLLLRRTSGGTPLELLVRLFLLGVPADIAAARSLHPTVLEDCRQIGLVLVSNGKAVPQVCLSPYDNLIVAVDWLGQPADAQQQVMEISASSATLAQITIRRQVHSTLDVGTGSGIQALLAAAHSDEVTGVDCNPRGLHFARFNAQLNRRNNVAWLEGDLFEPARGRQFDLILVNPPFVISPENRTLASDSGLPGDQLCQRIVREAPRSLCEGGFCQVVCNWAHLRGEDWRKRLAGWFDGSGCDAWVWHARSEDAATYAANRIREREGDDLQRSGELYQQWLAYYERERIEAISFGVIILRRRAGVSWLRVDEAPEVVGACGEAILRAFELRDFLERDDRALLDTRFHTSPDLVWEQQLEAADGWVVKESRLRLRRGLAYAGHVDQTVATLVARCRGDRPLRDVLAEFARSRKQNLEAVVPTALPIVRSLIAKGFLLPDVLAGRMD